MIKAASLLGLRLCYRVRILIHKIVHSIYFMDIWAAPSLFMGWSPASIAWLPHESLL